MWEKERGCRRRGEKSPAAFKGAGRLLALQALGLQSGFTGPPLLLLPFKLFPLALGASPLLLLPLLAGALLGLLPRLLHGFPRFTSRILCLLLNQHPAPFLARPNPFLALLHPDARSIAGPLAAPNS